jgi:hypothetical protein
MPQDWEPEPKIEADIAAAAKKVRDQAAAEPIPEKILQLALQLEEALATKHRPTDEAKKPS